MARPPTPLIVREQVLRHALDLIDEVGYDGFSLPRLAKRLGVQPPSLYHHFANRAELLTEATRTVVSRVELPFEDTTTPWREWCLNAALQMRDMILERPGVAPVVMWYLSTVGVPDLNRRCTEYLRTRGVPDEHCRLAVEGLERLTLGSAGVEAMRNRSQNPWFDADAHPDPSAARRSRDFFASSVRIFLAGIPTTCPRRGSLS